ncbi:MAG: hypothetical protein ACKVPX_07650 [Myxococcaceae bacterium]
MRRVALGALALTLSVLPACRCQKEAERTRAPPLLSVLPADADWVLAVPDLGQLGQKLAGIQDFDTFKAVLQLAGLASGRDGLDVAAEQLGFDIRDAASTRRAGLAPERGLAWVVGAPASQGPRSYAVIAVSDGERFAQTLRRVVESRLGRAPAETRAGAARLWGEKALGAPEVGVLLKDGFAFVAAGQEAYALAALALPHTPLAQDAYFKAAQPHVSPSPDVHVFGRRLAGVGRTAIPALVGTVEISRNAVSLQAELPGALSPSTLSALVPQVGNSLWHAMPLDVFAALRFTGDAALFSRELQNLLVASRFQTLVQDVSLQQDLFGQLLPGVLLGVSLAPTANFSSAALSRPWSRADLFTYVHFTFVGGLKDEARAMRALERLASAPPEGIRVKKVSREKRVAYVIDDGRGALGLAVQNGVWVGAAPEARLLQTLERLGENEVGPSTQALKSILSQDAVAFAVDAQTLVSLMRALPAESWGHGGDVLKTVAGRWLSSMPELRGLSVRGSARGEALQVRADLLLSQQR